MLKLSAGLKQREAINAKRRQAICAYLSSEDVEPAHIETMLRLVDLYGLLYSALPQRRATSRDIHQQAEGAALTQQKKIWRSLRGVDAQERHAKSEATAEVARKKVSSQLYQRVRGPAVIPRFAAPADREKETTGRRPDVEVTRFLQVGARYLKEKCEQAPDHLEECLAHVLLRAEGKQQPSESQVRRIKNRVHTRLMEAPELDDFDYCIAVGQDPGEGWLPVSLKISDKTHVVVLDPDETPEPRLPGMQ